MKDKKLRFLFHYSKFNMGGAEQSNLRMMNALIKDGHKIDFVLDVAGGSLEDKLDKSINVIHLQKKSYGELISKSKNKYLMLLNSLLYSIPFFLTRIRRNALIKSLKRSKYDIGIIGLQGLDGSVVGNSDCTYRFHWIRNDLKHCDPSGRVKENILKSAYKYKVDFFACVSGTAYESFVEIFPDLKDRALTFYNFINKDEMLAKSIFGNPLADYNKYDFKIVSVCRMRDVAKGIFRMFEVYSRLREEGYLFYWFLVGDGEDKIKLEEMVKEKGYEDGFVLTGHTDNPFPYYKSADMVAVLSYYEGLCGIINEAKVISKPVVCTMFSGVNEQITNNVNGIVLDNNAEAIYEGMKNILDNKDCLRSITNNILPEAIVNDDYKINIFKDLFKEENNA